MRRAGAAEATQVSRVRRPGRRHLTVAGCVLIAASCTPPSPPRPVPTSELSSDVSFLASQRLEGRAVGTAGGIAAARFLAERYVSLGVHGAFPAACPWNAPCGSGYFQVFEADGRGARNVLAALPGTDPMLGDRFVVLAAHFDHLGRSGRGSLAAGPSRRVHPGADDNGSGTAAVLQLARRLVANPPGTSVLFAHFDAEESGLLGSRAFLDAPSVPVTSIELMINLDMVGRLRGGELEIEVSADADSFRYAVDSVAASHGVPLRHTTRMRGRSDHTTFVGRELPAISVSTGIHEDYHRSTDTADKIDYAGVERVVDLVEAIVRLVEAR